MTPAAAYEGGSLLLPAPGTTMRLSRSSELAVAATVAVDTRVQRAVVDRLLWPSSTWMIRRSVPCFKRCVAKLCRVAPRAPPARRVHADLFVEACRRMGCPARRREKWATGSVQNGDIDGRVRIAARRQESLWPRELPVGAQDTEQLRRQHHTTVCRRRRLRLGPPLPCSMRMTLRSLSMLRTPTPTTSETRIPVA